MMYFQLLGDVLPTENEFDDFADVDAYYDTLDWIASEPTEVLVRLHIWSFSLIYSSSLHSNISFLIQFLYLCVLILNLILLDYK